MAATSSSAANGVPPPAGGELTTTITTANAAASSNGTSGSSSTNNNSNTSKNGSTSSSGGNAAQKKPAGGSRAAAKKLAKESGDQISVTEKQNGDGHKYEKDNKSNDVDVDNSSDQPRQQRAPRRGGLNQELRERIKQAYQAKTVNLLVRYNKLGSQFADFANNVAFLSRCAKMSMVPKTHRVYNQDIRNTRVVVRILDQCCYKIMMADLDHNRRRKFQVKKNREKVEQRLKQIMSPEDFEEIQKICEENREQHFSDVKEKQRQEFDELMEEYKSNEVTRRSNSRRGRRTISSDQGSETGDEQGYRDSESADPEPAPSVVAKAPAKEQPSENGDSNSKKQDAAPKTPKESKAKSAPVGKDSAKDASSSKK